MTNHCCIRGGGPRRRWTFVVACSAFVALLTSCGEPRTIASEYCDLAASRVMRCGLGTCDRAWRTECAAALSPYYRTELLSGWATCAASAPCASDTACLQEQFRALVPTPRQRAIVARVCAVCPTLAGPSTSAADCEARFFAFEPIPRGNNETFLVLPDDRVDAIEQCLTAGMADGGIADSGSSLACVLVWNQCLVRPPPMGGDFSRCR